MDSETELASKAENLSKNARAQENEGNDIRSYTFKVIDGGLWVGEGADAARAAYMELASIKHRHAEISRAGSSLATSASQDVARTKRDMYKENTNAHNEIEQFLRSGSGQSLAQVAVILTTHRTAIQGYSSELQGYAIEYTTHFTSKFPESGGENGSGGPYAKAAGNGTTSDAWSDGSGSDGPLPGPASQGTGSDGVKSNPWSDGAGKAALPGGPQSPLSPAWSDAPTVPTHNPLTSLLGAAGGGLPSLPSLASGGGGGLSSRGFRA